MLNHSIKQHIEKTTELTNGGMMNEFESFIVEVESVSTPLTLADTGDACIKVTATNNGTQTVVIDQVTARFCKSFRVAGRRFRKCFSVRFTTRISGRECCPIEIAAGEVIVFEACSDFANLQHRKPDGFNEHDVELDIYEVHDGVEFVRTLSLSDAESTNQ